MRPLARAAALGLVAVLLTVAAGLITGVLSLVTTFGNSMEPRIAAGDLVVVRAASYEVGDVVAYHSPELRQVVLHRIVNRDGDRFVFSGDHNDFLDPERLPATAVVGQELLHIPNGATWLQRLTGPPALAAATVLLLAAGGATSTRRTRRKDRRTVSPRHHISRTRALIALPPALLPVAAGVAALGVAGLALSGLAWIRPASASVPATSGTPAAVTFSYLAKVRPSAAYDGTTARSPQPIFRALADRVTVAYRYTGPPGTVAVAARLSTASGWTTTLPLSAPVKIDGSYDGTVTLTLSDLERRAEAAAQVIRQPAGTVTVTVVPTVRWSGGGKFAPQLQLALDALTLKPAGELSVTGGGAASGQRSVPATITALGRSIEVDTARGLGLVAVLVAVLAGLALAVATTRVRPLGESELIRRRYRSLVLPVLPMALAAGRPVVDVPYVDSLVKLAERYGLLVLTWSRGGVDTYLVQDEGTTYRYRTGHAEGPTDGATDILGPVPTEPDVAEYDAR